MEKTLNGEMELLFLIKIRKPGLFFIKDASACFVWCKQTLHLSRKCPPRYVVVAKPVGSEADDRGLPSHGTAVDGKSGAELKVIIYCAVCSRRNIESPFDICGRICRSACCVLRLNLLFCGTWRNRIGSYHVDKFLSCSIFV